MTSEHRIFWRAVLEAQKTVSNLAVRLLRAQGVLRSFRSLDGPHC
jgi:hypothetical protein